MERIEKKGYLHKVMAVLTGRVSRNIYFWIFYFLNFFQNYREFKYGADTKLFVLVGLILFYCLMVYFNNLWLLPRYFNKKRYKAYFLRFSILLFGSACGLLVIHYLFDKYLPLESFTDLTMLSLGTQNVYESIGRDMSLVPEFLIGTTVFMLFLFFFFFMAWFMNDYFVQQRRLEQALKEKLETDLALIKYQISPHFLFNTLNNLYGMSLINSDNLSRSLLDLASILRYILYESSADNIPFDREKEIMDAYIQLELLRLHNTKNLSFRIDADKNYLLPPLLWLAVLENTFKHGTRHISNEHFVDFKLNIHHNIWTLHSTNTFKTTPELHPSNNGGSGLGLKNLKKRLEIVYPGRYEIREQVNGNLYSVFIRIDLND